MVEVAGTRRQEEAEERADDKKGEIQLREKYPKQGVTFNADTVQALIDSTCWELFNQFKANSGE